MPAKTRRRERVRRDGPLQLAQRRLRDAVDDLVNARAVDTTHWQLSRYATLRDAIDIMGSRSGAGTGNGKSPCWIDALKLVILIDGRTHALLGTGRIPALWRAAALKRYRPQDTERLEAISAELSTFAKAVDDLFTCKPIYLQDPCPHCRQTHTYRWADNGERIRTPALAVAADERGAWCQACHDRFDPFFLGRLLRRDNVESVVA